MCVNSYFLGRRGSSGRCPFLCLSLEEAGVCHEVAVKFRRLIEREDASATYKLQIET